MTDILETVEAALKTCISTMRQAEVLISSLGVHDKWHEQGVEHRAFHDLLYKRLEADKTLTALRAHRASLEQRPADHGGKEDSEVDKEGRDVGERYNDDSLSEFKGFNEGTW